MKPDIGAQKYFARVPKQWDALYSGENRLLYLFNRLLRGGLYERYRLTFERCGDLSGKRVLDIGCGTGRYSIECAKRGAARVVGIDFAPSMAEFSRAIALQMNVADKCEFICGDFLTYSLNEPFDIVLALGLFDYIEEPRSLFEKIAQLHPGKFLASFPRHTPIWDIQRKIRYHWIKKCPIYNYTDSQLEQLCQRAGFRYYEILPCKHGYFLSASSDQ